MKKIIILNIIAVLLTACGGNPDKVNTTPNQTNTTNNTVNSTANNTVNNANPTNTNGANIANANKTANTTATKPAESGPKRISFAAGKSEGIENITLKPGESKQFVVGAKLAQILMIDADSKDTKISLVKGKVAKDATLEEPGHYDTTLLENGDYIFEVKNISKGELKTKITVIISGTHESR